jgi:anti-anti-sigma factor
MIIELDENIGIKTIKNFYLQLKEILDSESEIILDFKNVKRIDLSLVQVIISANREVKKKGNKIILKSVSKELRKQLYLAGFSQ